MRTRSFDGRARRVGPIRMLLPIGAIAAAIGFASPCRADEIRYRDPATCEIVVEKISDTSEETWATIGYRTKPGAPIKRIDTRLLVDIVRDASDSSTAAFASATQEYASAELHRRAHRLRNGRGRRAHRGPRDREGRVQALRGVGGRQADRQAEVVRRRRPVPLRAGELPGGHGEERPDARRRRAARARRGFSDEKGFLARYKEGKSRWYADAWLLKGQCQLALKKYDEAAATFDALYEKVLKTPAIGARFAYEAKLGARADRRGQGRGVRLGAAYDSAAAALQSLLEQAPDACSRADLGRFYNEARMKKARVMLDAATKNDAPTDFAELRKYLEAGTPDGPSPAVRGQAEGSRRRRRRRSPRPHGPGRRPERHRPGAPEREALRRSRLRLRQRPDQVLRGRRRGPPGALLPRQGRRRRRRPRRPSPTRRRSTSPRPTPPARSSSGRGRTPPGPRSSDGSRQKGSLTVPGSPRPA